MNLKPAMKKTLKVLNIITNTIIWVLLILTTLLLLATVVSNKTDVFGHRLYVIMSGSMEPTIMTKDAIVTKQIDEPQVGDVVAFENGNIITVHRIIKAEEQENQIVYQTQGDNNNTPDKQLLKKEQIKGKVQVVIPHLGGIILFLQSNIIFVVFAFIIILVFGIIRRMILNDKDNQQ